MLSREEPQELRYVRALSVATEDQRRLHLEREGLLKQRTQHRNLLQSLLVAQGVQVAIRGDFAQQLERLRVWDGIPLQVDLQVELLRC